MSDDDRVQLVAEIPPALKRLVDADPRYNREVVEAALWTEFGGHREEALSRREKEQRRRVKMIEGEIERREQELAEARQRLDSLSNELDQKKSHRDRILDEAADALSPEALSGVNPAIENWASKTDLSPEQFLQELRERME